MKDRLNRLRRTAGTLMLALALTGSSSTIIAESAYAASTRTNRTRTESSAGSEESSESKKKDPAGKQKDPESKEKESAGTQKNGKTSGKKESAKEESRKKKKTGFVKEGGRWYYYGKSHKVKTGWIKVGKRTFYGEKSGSHKGSFLTGWQTIGGKEYYFEKTGGRRKYGSLYKGGVRKVNGISCKFSKDGVFTGCKYAGSTSGFVNRIGELARNNQRKNNILATVPVAQSILETGYGRVTPYHNLFGIYGGRYSSEEDSFEGYNRYIRTYFPSLIGCMSYTTYAWRIGNGGYAEAGGYAPALLQIISRDNLTRFAR